MNSKRSGTIYVYNNSFLTEPQVATFSEILRNLALILFGSTFIPYLFDYLEKPTPIMVLLTGIIILLLFILSK